jgi:hypothetical protein
MVSLAIFLPCNLHEPSCRTTSESISGSHLGHDGHAAAKGDNESAMVASWPTDSVALIFDLFLLGEFNNGGGKSGIESARWISLSQIQVLTASSDDNRDAVRLSVLLVSPRRRVAPLNWPSVLEKIRKLEKNRVVEAVKRDTRESSE